MVTGQRDMRVPTELVPDCPVCGRPMTMNLRCDGTFVQDVGWYAAAGRYQDFLQKYERARVVYVELGVGGNTPVLHFWSTAEKSRKHMDKRQTQIGSHNWIKEFKEKRCA